MLHDPLLRKCNACSRSLTRFVVLETMRAANKVIHLFQLLVFYNQVPYLSEVAKLRGESNTPLVVKMMKHIFIANLLGLPGTCVATHLLCLFMFIMIL